MEVTVILEFADYWRATTWLTARRLALVLVVWGLVFVAWLAMLLFVERGPLTRNQIVTTLLALLMWPTLLALFTWMTAQRHWNTSPSLREPVRYMFTAAGLAAEGRSFTARHEWEGLQRVLETHRDFLVFVGPNAATVIPKRCFAGPQQVEVLRSLLRTHMPERAQLRK